MRLTSDGNESILWNMRTRTSKGRFERVVECGLEGLRRRGWLLAFEAVRWVDRVAVKDGMVM